MCHQRAWAKYNSSQYANVAFNMRIVWTSNPEPGALSSLRDQENETQTEHKVDCWSPDESKKEEKEGVREPDRDRDPISIPSCCS